VTIGAGEVVEPGDDTLQRAPLEDVSAELAETLDRHGRALVRAESQLPGQLAEAVEAGAATISVDGEVVDDVPSAVGAFLPGITFDFPPIANAPIDAAVPSPPATGTAVASTVPVTAQPVVATLQLLVDTDGRTWTAELLPEESANVRLREAFQNDIRSGAYGRAYYDAFGVMPDYDVLLAGETDC
jgi:hypothetical protein